MDLSSATADELKALFQAFLEERAREQNLMVPEPELSGKELHDDKNAPWKNGLYSSLKFPKYEYREYPRMLYNAKFAAAAQKYEQVRRMRVTQQQQQDYAIWVEDAQRDKDEATMVVRNQMELEKAWASGWRRHPDEAVEFQKDLDMQIATAAAELNWQDRNLGEKAKAERDAYDATLEEHLTDVPSQKVRKQKKEEAAASAGA